MLSNSTSLLGRSAAHHAPAGHQVSPRRVMMVIALMMLAAMLALAQEPSQGQGQGQGPSITTTITQNDGITEVVTEVSEPNAGPNDGPNNGLNNENAPGYHPARLLVKFRNGARGFLPGSGEARGFAHDDDLFLVNTPPGLSVAASVAQYKDNPNVAYAEPDYVVHADVVPNDTRWAEQWDMTKIAADLAWNTQTSASSLVVAIIDTGINETHPDLDGNVLPGWNCINAAANIPVGCKLVQLDDHGHGTHVAGTIGAEGSNNLGIAGINWTVKMMAFKFLNSGGSGNISDAIYAFNKIAELKASGAPNTNIRLTNNSWGGGGFSQALKDALAAVETQGIVNVCAAGNSGVNSDFAPMYPAAYNNRGIISVLATSNSDFGAGFTNYGLSTVDIAAPGVSTLSTAPTGSCALCDATGYKYLSGTSMASPHVAGAVAAMLHRNPALGAFMARDVILDPASYDVMSDPRAMSTSSGGRLNLNKIFLNPKLLNPPAQLNSFPTLTVGANIFAGANQLVTLSATASDADAADVPNLRMTWGKASTSAWLFGSMLNQLFPAPAGNPSSFTTPFVARTASVPYLASVADNRGGGASGAQNVTVSPVASDGTPDGAFSVSPLSVAVGGTVAINYAPSDPGNKGTPLWDMWSSGPGGSNGNCCYSGTSTTWTFPSAGVYRISVSSIDRYLEGSSLSLANRKSAVVSVGGATGVPPIATATITPASGPVPLNVNVDMAGSYDPDGTIATYFIGCGEGFISGGSGSSRNCTFNNPGTYWLLLQVQDNAGLLDVINVYVVATPVNGGGGDLTPPVVNVTSPSAGALVKGLISLTANATDAGGSGMKEVKFYLDNTATTPLGTVSGAGPTFTLNNWNSAGASNGAHTIIAIASDNSNNSTTSSSVNITVDNAAPTVSITAPVAAATVSGASVSITADAIDVGPSGVANVVFRLDDATVGAIIGVLDPSFPYGVTWNTTGVSNGSHTLYAIATDVAGNSATSAGRQVNVNNAAALPTIALSFSPAPAKRANVTITAAVTTGAPSITQVQFFINGTLVSTDSTGPTYSHSWKVSAAAGKTYTVYGIVTDSLGRTAQSITYTFNP